MVGEQIMTNHCSDKRKFSQQTPFLFINHAPFRQARGNPPESRSFSCKAHQLEDKVVRTQGVTSGENTNKVLFWHGQPWSCQETKDSTGQWLSPKDFCHRTVQEGEARIVLFQYFKNKNVLNLAFKVTRNMIMSILTDKNKADRVAYCCSFAWDGQFIDMLGEGGYQPEVVLLHRSCDKLHLGDHLGPCWGDLTSPNMQTQESHQKGDVPHRNCTAVTEYPDGRMVGQEHRHLTWRNRRLPSPPQINPSVYLWVCPWVHP